VDGLIDIVSYTENILPLIISQNLTITLTLAFILISICRSEYLSDGLHLSEKGNQRLFELFKSLLEKNLPSWLPGNIPSHMADWTALARGTDKNRV
jgi:hypothetical protein